MRFLFLLFFSSYLFSYDPLLEQYESVFTKLPNWDPVAAHIAPIGIGMTNTNYLLSVHDERYFVRCGAPSRLALGTDAKQESEITHLAASLQLAPPVLVDDVSLGIFITPFIDAQPVNLHNAQDLKKVVEMLRQLHTSQLQVSFKRTIEEIILSYLLELEKLEISIPAAYQNLILNRPHACSDIFVPCHLDMQSTNVLNDGSRLWLIDWEYGGMSDPLLDLASIASTDSFTPEEINELLFMYISEPSQETMQHFWKLCILADIRWALWSLIQTKNSSLDFSYEEDAAFFLEQANTKLNK